ncbi:apolipoprotein N-acyltransferase [Ruegeria sediminis]|uniref:Apolipoprotein N-acyltransferase n=1 Tax=Ruegeria sediminis TaxID=2583820 RepID=A0ABY2WYG0_9RHOB|nr:apolipoprotein N-acyltransferase [Ruegeria sediminis]TMV07628.1 apolipoprotein N-acyltransferase [Ruegeria sediminis]
MKPAHRWSFWLRAAMAALLGAVAAIGLAPFHIWGATLVSLVLLSGLFLTAETRVRAAWVGWAYATGYFGHALLWIVEPFLVDPDRHAWMAPFALVLMAGGMALFWAPAFWFARRPGAGRGAQAWLLVLALSLAEIARGYVLTGFPWAGLAQIWVDSPAAQLLSLIGPYGLGALTLAATLPLGAGLVSGPGWRGLPRLLAPAALFGIAAIACAALRPEVSPSGKTVRLTQPNAPQHQKWDPRYAPVFFERLVGYTAAEPRPDLIVWPETSLPVWLENAAPAFGVIADAAQGAPVVLGIQRSADMRIYNSLVYLDEEGRQAGLYDKHHLVPFGEYVPFGDLMARFGLYGFAATTGQGFSAGPGAAVLRLGELGLALPLICYEAVFPQDVRAAPERPALLLQITNDAWFGTRSGPYQHLAQAQMRAIEQGVPMVRSANTGVSAMIDPLGRITAAVALGEAGFADAALPDPLPPTLYSRLGDGPVLFALIVLIALMSRRARPPAR